jgi:hypothetical protein
MAPLVLAKDRDGNIRYLYRDMANIGVPINHGVIITWLSDEQAEQFLLEGLVVRIEEGAVDPEKGGSDPLQDCLEALERRGVDLTGGGAHRPCRFARRGVALRKRRRRCGDQDPQGSAARVVRDSLGMNLVRAFLSDAARADGRRRPHRCRG